MCEPHPHVPIPSTDRNSSKKPSWKMTASRLQGWLERNTSVSKLSVNSARFSIEVGDGHTLSLPRVPVGSWQAAPRAIFPPARQQVPSRITSKIKKGSREMFSSEGFPQFVSFDHKMLKCFLIDPIQSSVEKEFMEVHSQTIKCAVSLMSSE